LVLLGFAATDFVITKTLSAADAAEHLIKNQAFGHTFDFAHSQLIVTAILLVLLGATFMRGFKEVIGLAAGIVAVYLLLNAIVITSALIYLFRHGEQLTVWQSHLTASDGQWHFKEAGQFTRDAAGIAAACLLLFPKLALGLSG